MNMRSPAAIITGCVWALLLALAATATARAQAWVPPEGEGVVTYSYQDVTVLDHLDYTGRRFNAGTIRAHTQVVSVEYGLTDKLTLDADITHVTSKYVGLIPHGPPDTGSYHPTFQDAHLGVRYNVYDGRVVVTPFVGVVFPTHHYETAGHSAVGRGLRELQVGVNVGRDLEDILPRSYVEGRYSFAFVERVEELNLNRSNADWELGHFFTRRLSLRFTGAWQRTHGGLDIPLDHDHPDFRDIHDRAARAGYVRLGGGGTFSLNKTVDLHADYTDTVSGINTHAAKGLSLGMSWRFSRGFGSPRLTSTRR